MSALNNLLVKLAAIDVKPHVRLLDGKLVKVKGYRRAADISQGDFSPLQLKTMADKKSQVHPNVDFEDQRKLGPPVKVNPDALNAAMEAAGVKITPDLKIRLRLRDQNTQGTDQGLTQRLGPNEFRVVVKVANKPAFKEHHLYIMNNSLVHELRHVRQEQDDPEFGSKYAQQNLTVGYGKNKYEIEAREFGRLADPTGERAYKGLPKGMSILGKSVWGLEPNDEAETTKKTYTTKEIAQGKKPLPSPNPSWAYGPHGKLRNVKAMGLPKLFNELAKASPYETSEWYKKLLAELKARGVA